MRIEDAVRGLVNHFVVCGAAEAFLPFLEQLRRCDAFNTPVVLLNPRQPTNMREIAALGSVFFVRGEPSDSTSLRAVQAAAARALVFLAAPERPVKVNP